MKIRTTKYIIKEGLSNAYRNKLMSLASVSIVIAALMIFGIFFLIIVNINSNIKGLKEQSEIIVFCDPKLNDAQVKQIETTIKDYTSIERYTMVSKKEAFEKVRKMMDSKDSLLEGLDEGFLPVSFNIKLKNPEDSTSIAGQLEKITGIEKVQYPKQVIDFISKISYWVKLISTVLIVILLIVSIFIISNTIKLTVFTRRREINIMKYIGATDWFIRWPFIIEGIIIGFIGAIGAFILVGYAYNTFVIKINHDLFASGSEFNIDFIRLLNLKDLGAQVMAIYSIIGAGVGAAGSLISIRKYLHV